MIMMAMDEKTEKATPKKKRDAREKGHVLKSNDVTSAIILIGMFCVLKLFGSYTIGKTTEMLYYYMTNFAVQKEMLSIETATPFFLKATLSIFVVLAPILSFSVLLALVSNYLQVGFMLINKTLKPNFGKLNPIAGMKKMVSLQALAELIKASVKASVIIIIAYNEIKAHFSSYSDFINQNITRSAQQFVDLLENLLLKVGIAIIVIAAADYFYQWWQYNNNLKMSKQEVKDEFRQLEGDPKIKAKIRQKQTQLGMARMMNEVQKATVIITNPTHIAVALKYDQEQDSAPVVVAKGQDYMAQKIKEKGRENSIEIIEDKPLARALYASVEIGDAIPQEFFMAVAQILAEIYKIKRS